MAEFQYIPIATAEAPEVMGDPAKRKELVRCATSFRYFLNYWRFLDQEHGEVKKLGANLWDGQVQFITAVESNKKLYALKARKLGFTTIETAYDAWCLRFRDVNARVHLFSRRQAAAHELMTALKFGLRGLPVWMRLGEGEVTKSTYELVTPGYPCAHCSPPPYTEPGPGCARCGDSGWVEDRRWAEAYPTSEETAVEATCTHGHVDEWARMKNPKQVWQAIEPSMAGSCHIITTGRGPTNYSGMFWRETISGDNDFKGFFIHALNRPDRNDKWLEAKKKGMTELAFRHEYAMTWQDALFGGGDFVFSSHEIDVACTDFRGEQTWQMGRKYVEAWDIGRHQDAAVGIVLDVTDEVEDVVAYFRYRETPYPDLQSRIEAVHEHYGGILKVEKNSAGEAVIENLNISEDEQEEAKFSTTGQSKPKIIDALKIAVQNQLVRWDPKWESLTEEMRGYQVPDKDVVQDSVMALAIAHASAEDAYTKAKSLGVRTW